MLFFRRGTYTTGVFIHLIRCSYIAQQDIEMAGFANQHATPTREI